MSGDLEHDEAAPVGKLGGLFSLGVQLGGSNGQEDKPSNASPQHRPHPLTAAERAQREAEILARCRDHARPVSRAQARAQYRSHMAGAFRLLREALPLHRDPAPEHRRTAEKLLAMASSLARRAERYAAEAVR